MKPVRRVARDGRVQTVAAAVQIDADVAGLRDLQHVVAAPQRGGERVAHQGLPPWKQELPSVMRNGLPRLSWLPARWRSLPWRGRCRDSADTRASSSGSPAGLPRSSGRERNSMSGFFAAIVGDPAVFLGDVGPCKLRVRHSCLHRRDETFASAPSSNRRSSDPSSPDHGPCPARCRSGNRSACAQSLRDVRRFGRRIFRRAMPQVETVDHAPSWPTFRRNH